MAAPAPAPPPLEHAHYTAPAHIRTVHKTYQKLPLAALSQDADVLDFANPKALKRHGAHLKVVGCVPKERSERTFKTFREEVESGSEPNEEEEEEEEFRDVKIYEHEFVPGLQILPSLLPPSAQKTLLSTLLHTHLSNPSHLTNLHPHYTLPYPPSNGSFFTLPASTSLPPRDPTTHKPLTAHRMLDKKLRWITLGGQYDWTLKKYPEDDGGGPRFPKDVGGLITGLLPETITPQAAITNLYSPGDMLAPHRDVSEASRAALVSVSVGCDAIFIIGLDPSSLSPKNPQTIPEITDNTDITTESAPPALVLRVRSGDVIIMGGLSRWAWHSVPRVLARSCPDYLANWPGGDYEGWEGWMNGKRINLNVRQMWDDEKQER